MEQTLKWNSFTAPLGKHVSRWSGIVMFSCIPSDRVENLGEPTDMEMPWWEGAEKVAFNDS